MLCMVTALSFPAKAYAMEAGDEIEVTNSINTIQSETSPCQVYFKLNAEDTFSLSVYAEIENTDTGNIYRLSLYKDNSYMDKCFLEEGTYKVLEISSYEDSSGLYSFTYPDDFTIKAGETIDLETSLNTKEESKKDEEISITPKKTEISSDFKVYHEGEGEGEITINGTQNNKYDISISIESSGVPGGLSIRYTLDGKNWSEEKKVPLHGSIPLYEKTKDGENVETGLTATFITDNATDSVPFKQGDTYYSYVEDPKTSVIYEHTGDSGVEMEVESINEKEDLYEILQKNNIDLYVMVLKKGTSGEAVIEISLDGGKTFMEERFAPKDALSFKDLGFKISFPKSDIYELKEGDTYRSYPYKKSYTKAIVLGVTLILISILSAWGLVIYMKSKLPDDSVWHIHEFDPGFHLPPYEKAG